MMTKMRVTPFLVLNPLIAIWAIYSLIMLQVRGGFAVIMSGFFIAVTGVSIILLIVDRMLPTQINFWVIFMAEVLILLISIKVADLYLYG
jgi:hypothetical protein